MRGAVEVEEPGGEVLIRGNMRQQAEIGALRASSVRQPSAALGRHCRSIDAELLASETLEGCMEGIRPSTNLSQTARTQSGDADSAAGTTASYQ